MLFGGHSASRLRMKGGQCLRRQDMAMDGKV